MFCYLGFHCSLCCVFSQRKRTGSPRHSQAAAFISSLHSEDAKAPRSLPSPALGPLSSLHWCSAWTKVLTSSFNHSPPAVLPGPGGSWTSPHWRLVHSLVLGHSSACGEGPRPQLPAPGLPKAALLASQPQGYEMPHRRPPLGEGRCCQALTPKSSCPPPTWNVS